MPDPVVTEFAGARARGVLTSAAAPVSAGSARNLQSSNGGRNPSAPGEADRTQQGSRPPRVSKVQFCDFGPPASPLTPCGRDMAAEARTGRGAAHTRHPTRFATGAGVPKQATPGSLATPESSG
ncbi:hypothetical protein NDU88_001833 [Pleurodeles waltl]|uniref:Uncharacterized protein n=1 Tax=Pleurodeles waltl TaxID=8319 RepID=A0AAV7V8X1_PLEWA|nr:hypothetical protein NDU88_001833 [Pleurodeles waltl]